MKGFFDGITSYGTAVSHINKHGLWGYVLIPGIISVLIGVGVFGLAWGLSDNIGDVLDNLWRWEWGKSVVAAIAQFFGGVLVLAMSMIIFKQIIMVISSPIMSLLSEKVESQLKGETNSNSFSLPKIISDVLRGLRIAIRNTIRELSAVVFLLVLGLMPLFTPFTTVLIFLTQAYYAGFNNFDFALERRFRFKESIQFVHSNRMMTLGNGLVFIFLLLTFIGFLVALPLGVVAATIAATKNLEAKA